MIRIIIQLIRFRTDLADNFFLLLILLLNPSDSKIERLFCHSLFLKSLELTLLKMQFALRLKGQ